MGFFYYFCLVFWGRGVCLFVYFFVCYFGFFFFLTICSLFFLLISAQAIQLMLLGKVM